MSTATERSVLAKTPNQLLIGGKWVDGAKGKFAVEDPATGKPLIEIANGSADDAVAALTAADDAFASWRRTAPRERSEILRRAFDAVTARTDELALLMTLEMGKPIAEAKGEIAYAASFLRWYSEEAVRIEGRVTRHENGSARIMTTREPVGPCLFITPWNFPMAMGTRKIGPAVAAGCTMVVKPAQQTPLSMLALGEIFQEAGLPDGVLNIVTGTKSSELMAPLIGDPRMRKLSFTGSTEIGRKLIEQSADQILRVSMELGGNAPFLVFEDADIDDAVEGAIVAKMRNMGEACTAANRFHVHESVADEFSKKLADKLNALKTGRGTEDGSDVGPLIDDKQRQIVADLVDDAVSKGAKCLTGGKKVDGEGYFYEPTVLTNVPENADLLQDEIFGPVAPITTFKTDQEAIDAANNTEYGLVAYVYCNDLDRAFNVIERLDTGMIGLNQGLVSYAGAPFGGVKASGYGREGGPEGLGEYLEYKYVAIKDRSQ
jgi:succinate-semialdehyde dehydrogenase/glutarate-semialdehyde dehydrogenase